MMKLVSKLALGTLCAMTLGSPAMAFTPTVAWSMTANACTASSQAINAGRYETGAFVTDRGANTAPIILVCHVAPDTLLNGAVWDLDSFYQDSTGTGAGASVEVKLIAQDLTTGANSVVTTFNSNSVANTTPHKSTKTFTHTFDFSSSAYYVQIKLDRSNTGQTVRAYNVAIWTSAL